MTDRRRLRSSRARVPIWALAVAVLFSTAASIARADTAWTAAASPTAQTLWGVGANASVYVAVGEAGTILSSPDASTWTARSSGTDRWLLSVAWSPTLALFVAVGDSGTLLTSPDGAHWTPRASGTTQRLNAVLWGGGTFLVVGENGTALTSTDTLTWTARTTGDTGWLRGLAYGNGLFLVTGHDGTLLTTADAGVTFQRRHIATTEGINAATFADDRFVVFWSDFNSASSTDAAFWPIAPTYPSANSPHFGVSAATSLGSTLLAAGDSGQIYPVSDANQTTHWRAATTGPDKFVLVGTGGTIVTAPHAAAASPWVSVNISVNEDPIPDDFVDLVCPGDRVKLHAVCHGVQPTAWHWTFNGQSIAGANSADLDLGVVSFAQAGSYAVSVITVSGNTLTSASHSGDLHLSADTPTLGLIDPSFRPVLPVEPDAFAALPDGRIYVAVHDFFFGVGDHPDYALARLLADGSLDPAYHAASAVGYGDTVENLIIQPDGQLVVQLTHLASNGTTTRRMIRLNSDGSSDTAFQPDPLLRDSVSRPLRLADGRWLVATPTTDGAGNRTLTISRFRADGGLDATFAPLSASFAAPTTEGDAKFSTSAIATLDAGGLVYVSVNYGYVDLSGLAGDTSGKSLLFRLNADDSPDTGFTVRSFDEIRFLGGSARGLIVSTARYSTWIGGRYTSSIFRLRADGTEDPSFAPVPGSRPLFILYPGYANHVDLALFSDGSILTSESTLHVGLVRFDVDGIRDSDFSADYPPAITRFQPLANGQVLVTAGSRLQRLTPERHAARTRLSNLSVRAAHGTGEAGLIVGFVTTGGNKQILARAIGPSLTDYNVTGWLPDPQLRLVHNGAALLVNNNWAETGSVYLAKTFARVGAFPLASTSLDAAASGSIPAGPSTIEVADSQAATGIVLAELYDCDNAPADASAPRLVNLSARARTGPGDDSLIVGFTVAGANVRRFLIRAVGAPLSDHGVTSPLLIDPLLTLYRADGSIVTTADENQKSVAAGVTGSDCAALVGAFPLSLGFRNGSARIVVTLPPGNYTAVIGSASNTSAIVLLEIYELP